MEALQKEINSTPENKLLSNKETLTDWKMLLPWVLLIVNAIFLSMIIFSVIDRAHPLCSYYIGKSGGMVHTKCPPILFGYEIFSLFSSLFLTVFGTYIILPILIIMSLVSSIIFIVEIKKSLDFMNTYKEVPFVLFLKWSTILVPFILIATIILVNMHTSYEIEKWKIQTGQLQQK